MKKFVSLILVIILTLGAPFSVFAQEGCNKEPFDEIQNNTEFINVDGEVILTNSISKPDNNILIEAISDTNTLTTIEENEVFVNGLSVVKIEETSPSISEERLDQGIQLAIIYSDEPMFGDPSDYEYYGTSDGTTVFSDFLINLTQSIISIKLLSIMHLDTAANTIASIIIASLPVIFENSTAIYYENALYKHKDAPSFYWRNEYTWYYDSDHTEEIESEAEIVYACRA